MNKKDIKIPLGIIDIKELINNKDIFIFGTSKSKDNLLKMIEGLSYHLIGYCDNSQKKIGKFIDNVYVYSPAELKEYTNIHKECIIIIASSFEYEIIPQLRKELNITNKIIVMDEIYLSGSRRLLEKKTKNTTRSENELIREICDEYISVDTQQLIKDTPELVVYSAPKTGNTTINTAMGYEFGNMYFFSPFHSMSRLRLTADQKKECASRVKKIITGVRDAVAQNLSLIYQFPWFHCMVLGDEGYDAQKVFQYYIMDSIIHEKSRRESGTYGFELEHRTPYLIQSWYDDTLKPEFGIDLYEYPFDKEKGYSIYHVGKYEILVYQIEKMDLLYDVIRNFIGIETLKFEKTNDGKLKWYKDYYLNFLEKVVFEKEYIEKTYTGKMMKHFYSDEDIAKFKSKWESHII